MRHGTSLIVLLLIWIRAVMKGIGVISLITILQKIDGIKNNN